MRVVVADEAIALYAANCQRYKVVFGLAVICWSLAIIVTTAPTVRLPCQTSACLHRIIVVLINCCILNLSVRLARPGTRQEVNLFGRL